MRSLPAAWTDVVGVDAFVALAEGRSLFRVEDLLALVALIEAVRHPGGPGGAVRETRP